MLLFTQYSNDLLLLFVQPCEAHLVNHEGLTEYPTVLKDNLIIFHTGK